MAQWLSSAAGSMSDCLVSIVASRVCVLPADEVLEGSQAGVWEYNSDGCWTNKGTLVGSYPEVGREEARENNNIW